MSDSAHVPPSKPSAGAGSPAAPGGTAEPVLHPSLAALEHFPPLLRPLGELAANLWWSWDEEATDLFRSIDPVHWDEVHHNPVALLLDADPVHLAALARDAAFLGRMQAVHRRFRAYLERPDGWAHRSGRGGCVAYFSMEFGLHESLRLYSGGLGVLAGDHLRSASDLGLDMVGVSLLYRHGYFRQLIDVRQQVAAYPRADFTRLPVIPVRDAQGRHVSVEVPHGHHSYTALLWTLAVGRVRLVLLDADHDGNPFQHRIITHQLYGGDEHTRVAQEVLLGIGGVRALRALGIDPAVVHLNEGHCAFAPIEMARDLNARGMPLGQALQAVRQKVVFTTHTPVPAGHDRFSWDVVNEALGGYREAAGWSPGTIMDLGRVVPGDIHEPLCMTVLALRLSRAANGVSELHGAVSRRMWKDLYPSARSEQDVPIGHITNGVHPVFWAHPRFRALLDERLPGWREDPPPQEAWEEAIGSLDDATLWEALCALRWDLVERVRRRTGTDCLDPEVLTVGFARRFAPYKRANLLFTDPDRLAALVHGPRPMQVIFAGKAHPRDLLGQAILSEVLRWCQHPRFRGRIVFLEDYGIATGRLLTAGVDLWLNNPRRPREASGTSGQKVPLNGGLNASVLDGWWPEAYDGTNGWAIGEAREYASIEEQDQADAEHLYRVLEQEITPLFYDRGPDGIPRGWLQRVRRSMVTCIPRFNTHRMVREYCERLYFPEDRPG